MLESVKESPPNRRGELEIYGAIPAELRGKKKREVWWGAEAEGKEGEKEREGQKRAKLRFNFGPAIN